MSKAINVRKVHEGNRDAWNRTARGGYGADISKDVALLKAGGSNLMPQEVRLLAELGSSFERAIHLQCSHGLDALSLLSHGAQEVVGIDISEEMLAYAQRKTDLLGANASWIRSDVLMSLTHSTQRTLCTRERVRFAGWQIWTIGRR